MSPWKVILATLVIFVAGLVTGAVSVTKLTRSPRPSAASETMQPWMLRENFRADLDRRLDLSTEQSARIEGVMREGQERIKEIWALVGPEIQAELRAVREEIQRELTPDQRRKFEQMIRQRRPRPLQIDPPRGRDRRPPGVNTYPPGDEPR